MTEVTQAPTLSNPACFVLLDCVINGSRPSGKGNEQTVLVIKKTRLPTPNAKWTRQAMKLEYIDVLLVEKGLAQLAYLALDQLRHTSNHGQSRGLEHNFSAFSVSNMLRISYNHPSSASTHGQSETEPLDMPTEVFPRTIDCTFNTTLDLQRSVRVLESLGLSCEISSKAPPEISWLPAPALPPVVDRAEDDSRLPSVPRNSSYRHGRPSTSQGFFGQAPPLVHQSSSQAISSRTLPVNGIIDGRQPAPHVPSHLQQVSPNAPPSTDTSAQVGSYSINAARPPAPHRRSSRISARPTYSRAHSGAIFISPALAATEPQRRILLQRGPGYTHRPVMPGSQNVCTASSAAISPPATKSHSRPLPLPKISSEVTQETELVTDANLDSQGTVVFTNGLDNSEERVIRLGQTRRTSATTARQPQYPLVPYQSHRPHSIPSFVPSGTPTLDPQNWNVSAIEELTQPLDGHQIPSRVTSKETTVIQADSGVQVTEENLSISQLAYHGRADKSVQTHGTVVELVRIPKFMVRLNKDARDMRENMLEECAGAVEAMCEDGLEEARYLSSAYQVACRERLQEVSEAHFARLLQK